MRNFDQLIDIPASDHDVRHVAGLGLFLFLAALAELLHERGVFFLRRLVPELEILHHFGEHADVFGAGLGSGLDGE